MPGTRIGDCGNQQSDLCKSPSRPTTLAQQQGELVKRSREPRPTPATELPLDDNSCNGTEQWREVDGIRFCHWDRWLLRLALTEPEGLRSIAREFRQRVRSRNRTDETSEAMLAQIADLETRLARIGRAPDSILAEEERASNWLYKQAFKRVWHATSLRMTSAMQSTPRKILAERALQGNWGTFEISPAPCFAKLRAVVGDGWYDYRGTGLVVMLLETTSEPMLSIAKNDAERMAVHRAMLTVAIGTMDQVDDSSAELSELFREHEHAYLALLRAHIEAPGILRDLLELAVWEDYGLFSEVESFLSALQEGHADMALRELARIIAELRRAELGYQLAKARNLRQVLIAAVHTVTRNTDARLSG